MRHTTTLLTPKEIVVQLDRFIIGQEEAKKAVAVALRNRWRRMKVPMGLRNEILPKNILMIGPTGVGKTEIARRLAKLAQAPFVKVEATKFTEIGYVGRDVEQIIRDLLDVAITQLQEGRRKFVQEKAQKEAQNRILDVLVGKEANEETRQRFRDMLKQGQMEDREVDIQVKEKHPTLPSIDIPGMPGAQMGMLNLNDLFGKSFGGAMKKKRLKIKEARPLLCAEESDKLLDQDQLIQDAIAQVEQNGIVFLDEVDKICQRSATSGSNDISREGVQRDLLPLIEGTVVSTKHGMVKTDHILFIASGAFHLSKPSDLLPELQGRLPIRVSLHPLTEDNFVRILTEPESSLLKQYKALMATEQITLDVTDEAIGAIARVAVEINENVENIGARRLHTVMERVLEKMSYNAPDHAGETLCVDASYVLRMVKHLSQKENLSQFIL